MVGKAQRTKNNVKASNSGRSAQLLASLPNTSFIGFSTLKDAALHTTPDLFDDSISPDFQIILKKMNKKDSVTKHKALHEFAELCNNSDIETLKSILPLWPRLYSILSIDIENRVREATQYAHKCMVTRVKRNIAPHLKHLIGPWIVSQFDTYPPAASVAKNSFEDVFPPLKRNEVFSFCKDDIFNYIVDNLIVQTPQTMSNPKITDAINMEMKYERVISCTMHAYALFISKLPPDTLQSSLQDHTDNILSTAKFWKFQKHESNLIRSAWYLLVATFLEKQPQVFDSDLKKLAVAIFSNLNEKDSKVNANVWDAALYCAVKYEQELWKSVSVEKLVLPNICNTLESGFHGNATQIAPKLLPLLSKLANADETNPSKALNIYEKILTSLSQNIMATSVRSNTAVISSSESDAVVKCCVECCRYILKAEDTNPSSRDFCRRIVMDHLFPLHRIPNAHAQFSLCLRYLYPLSLPVTDALWEALTNNCLELETSDSLEKELSLHASLVQCLWNPHSVRKWAGPMKVKFNDDQGEGDPVTTKDKDVKIAMDIPCEAFVTHFTAFISKLVPYYLSQLSNASSTSSKKSFVLHLCSLCSSLDTPILYNLLPLPEAFNEWGLLAGDPIYELMCNYVTQVKRSESKQNVDAKQIMEQCSQNQTMALFMWCLNNWEKHRNTVEAWLQDEKLQDTLLSIAYQVTVGSENQTRILAKCFVPHEETAQPTSIDIIENKTVASRTHPTSTPLDIIIKETIASKIFLQLVDVFRNFGNNPNEDKIDYENCARALCLFLRNSTVREHQSKEVGDLLVSLVEAIMRRTETREMMRCWEAALRSSQPSLSTRQQIYRSIHSLCVTSLLRRHSPVRESTRHSLSSKPEDTLAESEDSSPAQIIDTSVILLSILMGGTVLAERAELVSSNPEKSVPTEAKEAASREDAEESVGAETKLSVSKEPKKSVSTEHKQSVPSNSFCWDTVFRPSKALETTQELWHIYCCTHGTDVCTCENKHRLDSSQEWNVHENAQVQDLYWNVHVYVRLGLNLLSRSPGWFNPEKSDSEQSRTNSTRSSFNTDDDRINQFFMDYFLHKSFAKIYLGNSCKSNATSSSGVFATLWETYGDGFVMFVERQLDLSEAKYGYVASQSCVRQRVKVNKRAEEVKEIGGTRDLIELANNISLLKSPTVKESFIKFVRDHAKPALASREDIAMATSLVKVFTKLMQVVNDKQEGEDCQYAETTVDTVRGELMLCLTSHLVLYYTSITSSSSTLDDPCGQIFLAAQLLRCYEQVDAYYRRHSGSEFGVEWESVFATDCTEVIANIWLYTASLAPAGQTIPSLLLLHVLGHTLLASPAPFPASIDSVLPLLLCPSTAVQMTAHALVTRFKMEAYDVFAQTLTSAQTVVAAMLENFSLGDTCIVLSNTDSFSYTLGYLLLWWLIVQKCDNADSAVRLEVAMWLKQEGYVSAILHDLLRLMPDSLVHCAQCLNSVQHLFVSMPSLQVSDVWDSAKLGHLVCGLYYQVLRRFPALVRQWWNEASPGEASLVEKLTAKYVSPLLCTEELKTAAKFTQENMVIRVFPSTKEVVATYTLEEASMEITICLPSNHPLGVIRVDSSKNLFPNTQWIKQITKFLIHANGSICDGLSSWKSNIDKKFDGVEECYICFCILHSRNHELPRKSCRTCQKKFHSYCLFKWFTTSNKSTCPICRNLF